VAEITPARAVKKIRLGGGAGTAVILGDIVGPIGDISEWEAAQNPDADHAEKTGNSE
jgi:hypothetical protein